MVIALSPTGWLVLTGVINAVVKSNDARPLIGRFSFLRAVWLVALVYHTKP